jgi:hypothetical protein
MFGFMEEKYKPGSDFTNSLSLLKDSNVEIIFDEMVEKL